MLSEKTLSAWAPRADTGVYDEARRGWLADLKDRMTLRGLIALQVHQIGDGTTKKPGEEIRWRNSRIQEL